MFLQDQLNHSLVTEFDEDVVLAYVSPVPEDREFIKNVIAMAPWAFTLDEIRHLAEYGALDADTGEVFNVAAENALEAARVVQVEAIVRF